MLFEILPSSEEKNQYLEYIRSDFSFATLNSGNKFFSSILINDINIAFDANDVAFSIFGISPFSKWESGNVLVPQASFGSLVIRGDLIAGVSYRVNSIDEYWNIVFDKRSGWIEVKNFYTDCKFVKIFEGAVIGVNCGDIIGLWLRPHMIE